MRMETIFFMCLTSWCVPLQKTFFVKANIRTLLLKPTRPSFIPSIYNRVQEYIHSFKRDLSIWLLTHTHTYTHMHISWQAATRSWGCDNGRWEKAQLPFPLSMNFYFTECMYVTACEVNLLYRTHWPFTTLPRAFYELTRVLIRMFTTWVILTCKCTSKETSTVRKHKMVQVLA